MAPTSTASAYLDHPSRTPRTEPTCVFNGVFAVRRCDLRVWAFFSLTFQHPLTFAGRQSATFPWGWTALQAPTSSFRWISLDFVVSLGTSGYELMTRRSWVTLGPYRHLAAGIVQWLARSPSQGLTFTDVTSCTFAIRILWIFLHSPPLSLSLSLYYCIYECCAPCILCILISIYNTWCTYCILWNYTPIHTYYIYNICIKKYISYYSMQRKG